MVLEPGKEEECVKTAEGSRIFISDDKNVLILDIGNGYSTQWMP